jgi:glycosyltransferase involved in cell wall biosynthesis
LKRILIDFTQIPNNKTGVGVYAINTFKNLNDNYNNYFFIIQNDDKDLYDLLDDLNISKKIFKINSFIFRKFIFRIIFEQIIMPLIFIFYKINISHSLHYSFPIFSFNTKIYVTIHDLTFILYPDYHTRFKVIYFKLFLKYFVCLPHKFICVSISTNNDFQYLTKINNHKIAIIPLGIDSELLNKYNINQSTRYFDFKYFLYIGTIEPRKNISNLIKAYYLYHTKHNNIKLVIVGGLGWHYKEIFTLINELNLINDIIFTGFVSEEIKYNILKDATLFIYPSFYEGFGLPILESLLFNIPTICSRNSSLIEVGGDFVTFINPYDYIDIKNKMLDVVNRSSNNFQPDKLKIHLKSFNWMNTLQKTIKLYNE